MGSVRWRITIVATAMVAVALSAAAFAILWIVESDLVQRAEVALEAGEIAFDEASRFTIDGEELELGSFESDEDSGEIFGELIGSDDDLRWILVIDSQTDELIEVLDPEGEVVEHGPVTDTLEESIFHAEQTEGEGETFFVIADELDEVRESLDAVRGALWFAVPLLTGLFSLLTYVLVGRALRPVDAITAQVASISSSDLDRRVPVPRSNDEVSDLATVMNSMLARLESGARRQREFSADASHELRSPLTSIRTAAEMISRRPDGERVAGLADDVVAEADRMDVLIGDLLELARADETTISKPERIDLAGLAAEVVQAVDSPIVELVIDAEVAVLGNSEQLRRVIQNLIDNAARHADSLVTVRIGAGSILEVADDGPGVPAELRDEIFGRFSRVDDARARGVGGTGLGLALVKAIVDRHGATIQVDDAPGLGGARFTIDFSDPTPGRL